MAKTGTFVDQKTREQIRTPGYYDEIYSADGKERLDHRLEQIDSDLTNLNKTKIECIDIAVMNGMTDTFATKMNSVLFCPREGFACMFGVWSNYINTFVGSIPSGITITKQANSREVTIANNFGHTFNAFIITTFE